MVTWITSQKVISQSFADNAIIFEELITAVLTPITALPQQQKPAKMPSQSRIKEVLLVANKQVEFLVKLRDAFSMAAEATNDYIDSLTPQEVKEDKPAVAEETFLILKFEPQQGIKLGVFEVSFKANAESTADKWQNAYDVLAKANATIKDRYHGKEYQFSYWLFGEGKIYRQKRKEAAL